MALHILCIISFNLPPKPCVVGTIIFSHVTGEKIELYKDSEIWTKWHHWCELIWDLMGSTVSELGSHSHSFLSPFLSSWSLTQWWSCARDVPPLSSFWLDINLASPSLTNIPAWSATIPSFCIFLSWIVVSIALRGIFLSTTFRTREFSHWDRKQ